MKKAGFTLIELSIVLVIIGLLVGGVLVGRDMIKAAEMRAQISQIEKLDAAIMTFKLKFNCLPGDCANATQFGLGTPGGAGQNGDGNGNIYTQPWITGALGFCCSPAYVEFINMWHHLSRAGMIEGEYNGLASSGANFLPDYTGYLPKMKMGSGGFVAAWTIESANLHPTVPDDDIAFGNSYYFSKPVPYPDLATQTQSSLLGSVDMIWVSSLDQKIDDGLPLTGKMRVGFNYSGPWVLPNPSPYSLGYCYQGTSNLYDVNSSPSCPFAISAAW